MNKTITLSNEDKKLITEFIGCITIDNILSWNILIPLYKKVKEKMTENNCAMIHSRQWHDVEGAFIHVDFEELFKSCIVFVNFYNKKSKGKIGEVSILQHKIIFWYHDNCVELPITTHEYISDSIIKGLNSGELVRYDEDNNIIKGWWRITK